MGRCVPEVALFRDTETYKSQQHSREGHSAEGTPSHSAHRTFFTSEFLPDNSKAEVQATSHIYVIFCFANLSETFPLYLGPSFA